MFIRGPEYASTVVFSSSSTTYKVLRKYIYRNGIATLTVIYEWLGDVVPIIRGFYLWI